MSTLNPKNTVLVGDIGGTNARFALVEKGSTSFVHPSHRRVEHFTTLHNTIVDYLDNECGGMRPAYGVLAVACPAHGDHINFTNNHWDFSIKALQTSLGMHELSILNDLSAVAMATPYLKHDDIRFIGPHTPPEPRTTIAIVGVGTGVGVSGLVPHISHGWSALAGEGGHVGFSPSTEKELAILKFATQAFGRVSVERLLCGKGLSLIYHALCDIAGDAPKYISEEEIVTNALADSCLHARETVLQFCAMLGSFAGDLALTLGARGGVYIAGGVVSRFESLLHESLFRSRFEDKGRFKGYNTAIPTYLMLPHKNPALLGAASLYL